MVRSRLLLLLLVGALAAAATAAVAQGARRANESVSNLGLQATGVRNDAQVSSNWAGYAITGPDATTQPTTTTTTPTTFTSVSARWVQPKARCKAGRATFSAFWVGLGGYSDTSQALEQIGTDANCSAKGKARYGMWYELVPAPSVPIKLKVFPGNVLTASVSVVGNEVTLQIRDLTRKTYATRVQQMDEPDLSSAEWIAEAPSACAANRCYQLPLANFGRVSFTHASATANEHTGTIIDPTWAATPIQLVADGGSSFVSSATSGAAPSDVSIDGTSFTVNFLANAS
jgi:Peptidase A4 family